MVKTVWIVVPICITIICILFYCLGSIIRCVAKHIERKYNKELDNYNEILRKLNAAEDALNANDESLAETKLRGICLPSSNIDETRNQIISQYNKLTDKKDKLPIHFDMINFIILPITVTLILIMTIVISPCLIVSDIDMIHTYQNLKQQEIYTKSDIEKMEEFNKYPFVTIKQEIVDSLEPFNTDLEWAKLCKRINRLMEEIQ